uniref:Secreted protein n=1 Tax=Rhizophora mucronata TaxID=61149 RepID=A0A2P2N1K5_RHIMU
MPASSFPEHCSITFIAILLAAAEISWVFKFHQNGFHEANVKYSKKTKTKYPQHIRQHQTIKQNELHIN